METNKVIECSICFYLGGPRDFTPITVSADFGALECPRCLNNYQEYFEEIKTDSESPTADIEKAA